MKANPEEPVGVAISNTCSTNITIRDGLTKRELFASMAMQGIITKHGESALHYSGAEIAVQFSDALIAELNK